MDLIEVAVIICEYKDFIRKELVYSTQRPRTIVDLGRVMLISTKIYTKLTWSLTTMTKTKIANKTSNKWALNLTTTVSVGIVCLSPVIGFLAFAPETFAQYGLGLPKSASSGGATRTEDLPAITLLVPEDGAKTFSSRPTFYWYIASPSPEQAASTTGTNVDATKESSNQVRFILREGYTKNAKPLFITEGKIDKLAGLYKFTLPENSPELVAGKVQRWQIRWHANETSPQINVSATIRRDDDLVVAKAIADAKTDLEKARIFTKNAYWYDAIDAYTNWLIKNPQDKTARTERQDLLKQGFKNYTAFSKDPQVNVEKLLTKLDASAPISINWKSKELSSSIVIK